MQYHRDIMRFRRLWAKTKLVGLLNVQKIVPNGNDYTTYQFMLALLSTQASACPTTSPRCKRGLSSSINRQILYALNPCANKKLVAWGCE